MVKLMHTIFYCPSATIFFLLQHKAPGLICNVITASHLPAFQWYLTDKHFCYTAFPLQQTSLWVSSDITNNPSTGTLTPIKPCTQNSAGFIPTVLLFLLLSAVNKLKPPAWCGEMVTLLSLLSFSEPPSEPPAPESSRGRRPGLAHRWPRHPAARRRWAADSRRTAPPGPCWWAVGGQSCAQLLPDWRRAPPAERRVNCSSFSKHVAFLL